MRLTSRSLALLLSAIGAQSFAPPRNRISSIVERCTQPSSLAASSPNELSGILNEYKSGAAASTVSTVDSILPANVEPTIQPLTDAVKVATDAAEQASQAAAAVMASSAAKVSYA